MPRPDYSSDGPSDEPCLGCGRYKIHKFCPAYGTAFYMSGYTYTEEIERAVKKVREHGGFPEIDQYLLNILKTYGKKK